MALFGKKTEEKKTEQGAARSGEALSHVDRNLESVIVRPHVTEKAAHAGEHNVYTFVVRRDASKYDVRDAIKELFNVTPEKIRIVNKRPRKFVSRARGRRGVRPGMKKAYVYLRKEDSIDIV